jgi:hypothetical protein
MDADRFDALSRALTTATTRRAALKGLLGLLVSGVLLSPFQDALAAAGKEKAKGKRKTKRQDNARLKEDRPSGQDAGGKERRHHSGKDRDQPPSDELTDEPAGIPSDEPTLEPGEEPSLSERGEVSASELSTATCLPPGAKPCRQASDCCSGRCKRKKKKCLACPTGTEYCSSLPGCVTVGECLCPYGETVCAQGCKFTMVSEAIAGTPSGGTIRVVPGTYDADLVIGKDLTLKRCGDSGDVILRNKMSGARAVTVKPGVVATLEQLTVSRNSGSFGGGIHNEGTLTLNHCTLHDNARDPDSDFIRGPAIDNWGDVTLTACIVSGNAPGAIHNRGEARLVNTTIGDNKGTPVSNAGTITLTDCAIRDNEGSGLSNDDGTVGLTRCVIERNAGYQGGAVFNLGEVTLTDCQIRGNTARSTGGIFSTQALVMRNCEVSGNSAQIYGGGVAAGNAHLTDCEIFNNTVEQWGGGIYFSGNTLTLENCTIRDNLAGGVNGGYWSAGGGVYASWGDVSIIGCTISGNRADGDGGGVRSLDRMTFDRCTIDGNTAADEGGGLLVDGGIVTFVAGGGSSVTNNSAGGGGGGIRALAGSTVTLHDNTVSGNSPDNCRAASPIAGCSG